MFLALGEYLQFSELLLFLFDSFCEGETYSLFKCAELLCVFTFISVCRSVSVIGIRFHGITAWCLISSLDLSKLINFLFSGIECRRLLLKTVSTFSGGTYIWDVNLFEAQFSG